MISFDNQVQLALAKAANLNQMNEYGLRRTYHGFYYISHYYPLRAMQLVEPQEAKQVIESLSDSKFETYIHFPFCEQMCTFCHFYKRPMGKDFDFKEDEILTAIETEMEMYAEILGGRIPARSLQLGGGTPSLISNPRLVKLLSNVRKCFDLESTAEIKIEIFPKYYEEAELREKLRILKAFGFTDIVIDLESGSKKTLDFIARKSSSLDAYLKLVDICVQEGFDSIVTALIIGLPHETFDSLGSTLETLVGIPEVRVINTFPIIMRETDPISKQLKISPEVFNDATTRDAMWCFARDYLKDRGYTEGPISYLHHPSKRPEQQADKFECVNLLGFGISSFGYLNGSNWAGQYYNYCNHKDYLERIKNRQLPMWRLGKYGQDERARRKVIFGLANVKTEDLIEIEIRFGVSIDEIYGKVFNAFLELGLISVDHDGRGICYTEKGLSRLEELSYFLSSTYVKDVCDQLPSEQDPYYPELINQHYFVTIPLEDRKKFESFIEAQPKEFMHKLKAEDTVGLFRCSDIPTC
jgi:oxygen-independent coproporphyrinogen III oxidase